MTTHDAFLAVHDPQTSSISTPRDQTTSAVPMCVLHMRIPVEARRRAKMAAVAAGLPFRVYVARLLAQSDLAITDDFSCDTCVPEMDDSGEDPFADLDRDVATPRV